MKTQVIIFTLLCYAQFALGAFYWQQEAADNSSSTAPAKRYHHGFEALGSTIVLVAGFTFSSTWQSDTWLFNTNSKSWTQAASHGITRAYHTLTRYGDNTVILFAGTNASFAGKNDVWRYTLSTNSWAQDTYTFSSGNANDLLRQYHAAVIKGDKMYVFGGYNYALQKSASDLWVYDLPTKVWTKLQNDATAGAPTGRQGHTMNLYEDPSRGTSLLVFGGYPIKRNTEAFADVWQYVISTGKWYEITPTDTARPTGRYGHIAQLINSQLFVYAGYNTLVTEPPKDQYWADTWNLQLSGNGVATWKREIINSGATQGHKSTLVNGVMYYSCGYIEYFGQTNVVKSLRS